MSLTETMRAVDQLAIAFWKSYLPPGARPIDERDQAAMQRAFHQALAYGIDVGLTAQQVADAAFYWRRVAMAGNTPVCLAGRSFHKFASVVEACSKRGES